MKTLKKLITIILATSVFLIWFGSAFADSDFYLFDILKKPTYLKSWNNLFRKEKNVDPWLLGYAKTKNGPSSPRGTVKIGNVVYQIGEVCETHNCGDNNFYVLFAPNGAKAWGLQVKNGNNERFFGKPDDEVKNALRSDAQQ
jgi:hypothetical protein